MKRLVCKYKISKFRRFMSGLAFGIISIIALSLCVSDIYNRSASQSELMLPFLIAIVSMLMGFISMFHEYEEPKGKTE